MTKLPLFAAIYAENHQSSEQDIETRAAQHARALVRELESALLFINRSDEDAVARALLSARGAASGDAAEEARAMTDAPILVEWVAYWSD